MTAARAEIRAELEALARDGAVVLPAGAKVHILEAVERSDADDTVRVAAPGWLLAMTAEVDLEADALLDGDH